MSIPRFILRTPLERLGDALVYVCVAYASNVWTLAKLHDQIARSRRVLDADAVRDSARILGAANLMDVLRTRRWTIDTLRLFAHELVKPQAPLIVEARR